MFRRVYDKLLGNVAQHYSVGKFMGSLLGEGSRCLLSRRMKFSFLLQTIFTCYFLQQIYTSSFTIWLLSKLSAKCLIALRPVSTSSTLISLQLWDGSYPTYCTPTGDGGGGRHYMVSLRLVDDEHIPEPLVCIAFHKCFLFPELSFRWDFKG